MKHKHHDIICQWAADTSLVVQVQNSLGDWVTRRSPAWDETMVYRIKPKRIKVGRHEWPEPLKEMPPDGATIWTFTTGTSSFSVYSINPGSPYINSILCSGRLHLTKEEARQHCEAIRCIIKGDV